MNKLSTKIQNIGWQLVGAFFNRGAFFISMILLAKKLNMEEYGKLGFTLLIINSISGIIVPAMGLSFRNELPNLTIKEREEHLSINVILIFIIGSFITVLVCGYCYFFLNSYDNFFYLGVLYLNFLFLTYYNFFNYYYAGIDDFKNFNIKTSWIGLSLIPLIIFLQFDSSFFALVIFLLVYILTFINLVRGKNLFQKVRSITYENCKAYLIKRRQIYLPIFLQSIVNLPVISIVQFFIISFTGDYFLIGIITFASQIVNLISIIVNRINSVTIPSLNKIKNNITLFRKRVLKEARNLLYVSTLGSIAIVSPLPLIISKFKPDLLEYTNQIMIFIIFNIITYLYWFTQEINIIINRNWLVFYSNLVWACLVIFTTFILLTLDYNFNLLTYATLIIGSRFIVIFFLLKSIFNLITSSDDKIYF